MPDQNADDAFAKYVIQHTLATATQIDSAREFQTDCAKKGTPVSLGDALVKLGVITLAQRDSVEQRLQTHQKGGIIQLLHYKLHKKLGEGGMGAVYLAEDTLQSRKVALKVLPRQHASNPEFMKRFQREADAMGRLNHVNIVRAFSVGEDQGRHFFIMEYCDGEPLDKTIKKDGFIAPSQALDIMVQVARGLQYAHALGVIHRDIKPANVIMSGRIAKILDLGLSKNIEGGEQSFLTQSGVAMGTPHYMSPEQARGEKDLDDRADIYSAGAMLYHLVTGDTPFHGSSAFEVVTKHLNEQIPDPRDIREEIPEGVVHIIRRMMAKNREDRYRDCGELLKDLERVIDGLTPESKPIDAVLSSVALPRAVQLRRPIQSLRPPSTPHTPPKAAKPALSKRTIGLIAGGVALAILIPVLIFTLGEGTKPEPRAVAPKPVTPQTGGAGAVAPKPVAAPPEPEVDSSAVIRENYARSQLRDIRERDASGKYSTDELIPMYEGIAKSYGDTKSGREAQEILDRLKVQAKSPPNPPTTHPSPLADQRPWKTIFNGTTLDCFSNKGDGGWKVEDGVLTNVSGKVNAKWMTNQSFGDGEILVRFEVARCSWLMFNAFSSPPASTYRVILSKPELTAMAGKQQVLIFSRKGEKVSATLNEKPLTMELEGPPSPKGNFVIMINDGTIRISKVEYREAPSSGQPTPVDDAWIKSVQSLPAVDQVKKVVEKLKELNPGYTGEGSDKKIENGVVTMFRVGIAPVVDISPIKALSRLSELRIDGTRVSDLRPIRGLPLTAIRLNATPVQDISPLQGMGLVSMDCRDTKITDISALKGMPLKYFDCGWAPVSNLSPLSGMPLETLYCAGCKVTDFTPLRDLPLKELKCYFVAGRDSLVLRSIKTLEIINDMPVAEFWAKNGVQALEIDQKDKDGWTCIFNGKDLAGWKAHPLASVDAGSIHLNGNITRKIDYPHFELRGSVRLLKAPTNQSDVGVGNIVFPSRDRLKFVKDGDVEVFGSDGTKTKANVKGLADGEYHTFHLSVTDAMMAFFVDGSFLTKARITNQASGTLELNAHQSGSEITYKDLWIREITPDGKPAVNITDNRSWRQIFDGKTTNFIQSGNRAGWRVENGVLLKNTDINLCGRTSEQYSDGEIHIRFETQNSPNFYFTARVGEKQGYALYFGRSQAKLLDGRTHDIVFKCIGSEIAATFDGLAMACKIEGPANSGPLQFNCSEGIMRIYVIEYKEVKR